MNPKRILLYIVGVLIVLFWLTFFSREFFNEQGASMHGVKIGEVEVLYPTFNEIIQKKEVVKNNKAEAVVHHKNIENTDKTDKKEKTDSVTSQKQRTLTFPKKEKVFKDSLRLYLEAEKPELVTNVEGEIYYPTPATDFVQKLHEKLSQPKCRIIHYGDSKLEGDRITAYLRNWLQIVYGGTGPGYFPIKMPYQQQSVYEETSGEWYRYALFNAEQRRKKELLSNNQYGLYANVSRFTPVGLTDTTSVKTASFTIKPSYAYYSRLSQFSQMTIHYGNCISPTTVTISESGKQIRKENLQADGKYHNLKIDFGRTPRKVTVEFSGKISPDFYGISLESARGIQMDNVPTRGDSGYHFTKLQNSFEAMSKEVKPDIFIFQFGGNLIPSLSKNKVKSSVKRIITNMKWVKKRNPEALFILIGPSDIMRRDTQASYEIIPELVEEMKKQAIENDIAFWSMFEAMGGLNSMKVWYDNQLGSGDFTHFTQAGTERISELFFQELMKDLVTVQKPELYKQ